MNRREILRAIALGGGIVAGELWILGARKIFLPPAVEPAAYSPAAYSWDIGRNERVMFTHWILRSDGQYEMVPIKRLPYP